MCSSSSSFNSSNSSLNIINVNWTLILVLVCPPISCQQINSSIFLLSVYFWSFLERSVLRCPANGSVPPDLCSVGSHLHTTRWQHATLGSRVSPHVKLYGGETSFDSFSDPDTSARWACSSITTLFLVSPYPVTVLQRRHIILACYYLLIFFLLPGVISHFGSFKVL